MTEADQLLQMREFAKGLPDELGPMFGRDVVRLIDECNALREALQLTEFDDDGYCPVCSKFKDHAETCLVGSALSEQSE
jgi:hypothetical protein